MDDKEKQEREDLKNTFISSTSYDERDFNEQLRIVIEYANIDETGKVRIKVKNLTQRQQILLTLLSRFMANRLKDSIPSEVGIDDIVNSTGISTKVILARLTDSSGRDFVVRIGRGKYVFRPIKIWDFLKEIGGSK